MLRRERSGNGDWNVPRRCHPTNRPKPGGKSKPLKAAKSGTGARKPSRGIKDPAIDRSIDGESRRDLFMSMIEVKTVNSPRDCTSWPVFS